MKSSVYIALAALLLAILGSLIGGIVVPFREGGRVPGRWLSSTEDEESWGQHQQARMIGGGVGALVGALGALGLTRAKTRSKPK